jgi:hypothetical protein
MAAMHRQGMNGNGGGGGGGGLSAVADVERQQHPMSALSPRLAPPPVVGLHSSKLSATPVGDRR